MECGIVLVHGYLGSSDDLESVCRALVEKFGKNSVKNIKLPNHDISDKIPSFDNDAFTETINQAITEFVKENRTIVLLGHSTGGTLILSTLLKYCHEPVIIILAGTPYKIDLNYADRWEKHTENKKEISFVDISKMVLKINEVCKEYQQTHPLLILQGENDELVPAVDIEKWSKNNIRRDVKTVIVPNGSHNLLNDKASEFSTDIILRRVSDAVNSSNLSLNDKKVLELLQKEEKQSSEFINKNPYSSSHLSNCPGGKKLVNKDIDIKAYSVTEPVFANIEITNYCDLTCKYCIRRRLKFKVRHMHIDKYKRILQFLPNAYRITLVGHGEPLQHPDVVEFVKAASEQGRYVSIVTSASNLNMKLSQNLINAGLNSIVFSIDYSNQEQADKLRNGTDFALTVKNIKDFVSMNGNSDLSIAAFGVLSITSLPYIESLFGLVSDLGIKVLMLTDLNFEYNIGSGLWKNIKKEDEERIRKAVKYAFSKNLIVLGVRGLESFGLNSLYHNYLLLPPDQLYKRSIKHSFCYSPWQTVPVDVDGNISICDCMPTEKAGNLFEIPFSKIWNGEKMMEHRRNMLKNRFNESCRICARF